MMGIPYGVLMELPERISQDHLVKIWNKSAPIKVHDAEFVFLSVIANKGNLFIELQMNGDGFSSVKWFPVEDFLG